MLLLKNIGIYNYQLPDQKKTKLKHLAMNALH